jgi:hypothetical protein
MKFVVDNFPKEPSKCLFVMEISNEPQCGFKPRPKVEYLCQWTENECNIKKCEYLKELKENVK